MLPSILAKQLQKGIGDYIATTFPMTNEPFKDSVEKMLANKGSVYHEPYVAVRLPFRVAAEMPTCFEAIHPAYLPYVHQQKAFERLTGDDGRSTLVATGTGSGKTECFLYPILEYCYQHRGERGIKALIIYPMNALATDQAKRIAELIYGSDELRGNVTVGMYVGGQEHTPARTMSEHGVITDHETMLNNAPDILMTNYKMLDYLLVRPKDALLWQDNNSETLKYIAVDELHTFDGAQGTDLACLLRRLKRRLGIYDGYLCCVGTSATMGSKENNSNILNYAEEIFGEPFDKDAIITEDRLSAQEFFAGAEVTEFTLPTVEQAIELEKLSEEDEPSAYLQSAVKDWLPNFSFNVLDAEGRIQLGYELMHHSFMQSVINLTGGTYYQVSKIAEDLAVHYPDLKTLPDADVVINSLFALISHARTGKVGKLRPFLNVQVQLWMRELRRLVAKVDSDETVSEVPVPDADYRKQYLVIYDSVPGGTGYLKQLMHEKNALIEIFERALHVMENCSCKDDPQKDGCYHCLYAYRQSQQIGNISRTTAIRILKSILSGKDNVQKIDKINDIPVNPLFDSELEQRFMEAIRTKVGAANVSDTIRNGKHSYYVKIENFAWEIEPQVPLDAGSGVSVDCKPDFVFWPVSAPEHKPVAVFTDGFLYHKDIVSDDTIKREAIRRSGNFRVWSLSFKDVQSVFAPQGDFYTTTLEAEKMPSGKTMYQNMIKKQKADVIEPARLSSFDLLLEYLKLPDAERVFKGQAYAYSLSLLEPALMKNNLAFNNWEMIVKAVNDQTHFTNADFVFLGTIFGSWIPRTSNAHLAIHSAILASELKAGGAVAVCAVLNDEKDRRTDKYEQEWNGLWRFYNVMQFSDEFIAVSSVGMSHMDYLALPVAINADSDTVAPVAAVDDAWNAIKELLFDDDAKAFVEIAKDAGVPAPDEDNIGYEVEGGDGEVVAAVEIAWPDRRIGFMTAEQAEDKEKLEKLGWRILNLLDAANMDVASYFGGDNQ